MKFGYKTFWEEEEEEAQAEALREPGEDRHCSPDKLLEFIWSLGRMPTLQECKKHFGGILGPLFDGWELERQGRFPQQLRRRNARRPQL